MLKKILLAIIFVLALALPVGADETILVYFDGRQVGEGVLIDGKTYVPIRTVSEAFGAKVDWDGSVKIEPSVKRPKVFIPQIEQVVNEALDLLEEKDKAHYNLVCQNVERIRWTMDWVTDKKVYAIGQKGVISISETYVNDKKRLVPEHLAGVLVHEAVHAAQDAQNSNRVKEREEHEAYAHEKLALQLINAPQWMIDEATRD